MSQATSESFVFPSAATSSSDILTEVIRRGARALLTQAGEQEAAQWIADHAHLVDEQGHRQIVRNGHAAERSVVTGIGSVPVMMPRVHDRRPLEVREHFTSKILPPYLRKARSIEELTPWLYLKGVSTGDFNEALVALVDPNCPGLSASTVVRLKATGEADFRGARNVIFRTSGRCTCGPTAYISTCAWKRIALVFSCFWA